MNHGGAGAGTVGTRRRPHAVTARALALALAAHGCSAFAPWPAARSDAGGSSCAPASAAVALAGATGVAAAGFHTCALQPGGTAACWGELDGLQYGCASGGRAVVRAFAVGVVGLADAREVAAGGGVFASEFDCARTAAGAVRCWGFDDRGQRGDGEIWPPGVIPEGAEAPTAVDGVDDATALAAGGAHACALRADRTVVCWGANRDGECGGGSDVPVVLRAAPVAGLADATALAAGGGHTCAAVADGTARCWGANARGELGDGSLIARGTPVVVTGLRAVAALAAGWQHTCALVTDGTVWCWGANDEGQLGVGSIDDSAVAVAVPGLADVVALAAGAMHTCAVRTDGAVWCWGASPYDEVGGAADAVCHGAVAFGPDASPCALRPVQVAGLAGAARLALGVHHSCALLADGSVRCWGRGAQLGNAAAGDHSRTPLEVQR